jgi:stage IV sporulation protein FB
MGWDDRTYDHEDRGPVGRAAAPMFGPSLPLGNLLGVRVRVHYSLPIFIIALALLIDWHHGYTLASKAFSLGALVLGLMAHELGHILAARAAGADLTYVVFWPLGGLETWGFPKGSAGFVTAIGGPLFNLMTAITCAAIVWFLAGKYVPLNPFHPLPPAGLDSPHSVAMYAWWLFVANYDLMLLNLLPIAPLDGAKVIQTALAVKTGVQRSALAAAKVGMVGAAGVVIFGLAYYVNLILIAIGAALFIYCAMLRVVLKEEPSEELVGGEATADFHAGFVEEPQPKPRRRVSRWVVRRLRRQARREAAELARLDSILAKVSAQGLASLTWTERRALRRATRRKREMEIAEK